MACRRLSISSRTLPVSNNQDTSSSRSRHHDMPMLAYWCQPFPPNFFATRHLSEFGPTLPLRPWPPAVHPKQTDPYRAQTLGELSNAAPPTRQYLCAELLTIPHFRLDYREVS